VRTHEPEVQLRDYQQLQRQQRSCRVWSAVAEVCVPSWAMRRLNRLEMIK